MTVDERIPGLTAEQLTEMLQLLPKADSVELKLSVPDSDHRSTAEGLGMDPLDAQLRQVAFFDTPDLDLYNHGVVVRARRVQRKAGDSVIKLRPVVPGELPQSLRKSPAFGVEVDAMPGGFVCSASMKAELDNDTVREAWMGKRRVEKLFTKDQRAFFASNTPDLDFSDLELLGPINVMKLKFTPPEYGRRLVAELWFYPDNTRVLELSTKTVPTEAFQVAAMTKAFLGSKGVDLFGAQQAKTKTALEYFARMLQPASTRPD